MGRDIIPETWHKKDLQVSEEYSLMPDYLKLKEFYLQRAKNPEESGFIEDTIQKAFFQINKFNPTTSLSNLILPITSCCNLNCKGCTSFSPLCERTDENKSIYSLSQISNDLKCLKDKGFKIREISVEGGEPLLHPDIIEIMKKIREIYPLSMLVIQTNGLLLHKFSEEDLSALASSDCEIIIDNYFPKVSFKKFRDSADKVNLRYTINDCYSEKGYFFKHSHLPDSYSENSLEHIIFNYFNCEKSHSCITLLNGKIFYCGPSCYIQYLNKKFNLNYPVNDIDIYQLSSEDIAKKLSQPHEICGYCKSFEPTNKNWNLSERKLSEWTEM